MFKPLNIFVNKDEDRLQVSQMGKGAGTPPMVPIDLQAKKTMTLRKAIQYLQEPPAYQVVDSAAVLKDATERLRRIITGCAKSQCYDHLKALHKPNSPKGYPSPLVYFEQGSKGVDGSDARWSEDSLIENVMLDVAADTYNYINSFKPAEKELLLGTRKLKKFDMDYVYSVMVAEKIPDLIHDYLVRNIYNKPDVEVEDEMYLSDDATDLEKARPTKYTSRKKVGVKKRPDPEEEEKLQTRSFNPPEGTKEKPHVSPVSNC